VLGCCSDVSTACVLGHICGKKCTVTFIHTHTYIYIYIYTQREEHVYGYIRMNNGCVRRPVALRDFGYRNEWRFINIIIERCVPYTLPSHVNVCVCVFIIVYDRFIRLTLPNVRRQPDDRWSAIRRQPLHLLSVLSGSLRRCHRPRTIVVR
jgi:hypothetical protein